MDANLLVLLVAGATVPRIISRHTRLRTFGADDFERLRESVARFRIVLVTPNTLTEASNLLRQHGEPERSRRRVTLGILIRESREVVLGSANATDHSCFSRLGLTDAVLLGLVSRDSQLVTIDLDLCLAASASDPLSVVNYRHVQERHMSGNFPSSARGT